MKTLEERTHELLLAYSREDRGYAFGDSGDAEMYADKMVELLSEWVHRDCR